MRATIVLAAGLVLAALRPLPAAAQQPAPGEAACDSVSAQEARNQCYAEALAAGDRALSMVYDSVLAQLERRPKLAGEADRLRAVQRAWLDFVQQSCALEAARFRGGSLEAEISARCRLDETEHRAEALRRFLTDLLAEGT